MIRDANGQSGAYDAAEVDHIVERRDGGTDHPSNLRLLCQGCHQQKRRRQPWAKPPAQDLVPVIRGRADFQPSQVPAHNHGTEALPALRGNPNIGWWAGHGCPPGCDLPRNDELNAQRREQYTARKR